MPALVWIFNSSITTGYCPKHFRESIIISLRKPNKPHYSIPKAYRPIALLNTMGKVMESIIATRLSFATETHNLLPRSHFGGRRGTSSEHALHFIMERIHSAWAAKKVATLLLLDATGVFDNVSHPRLFHNLRKRCIGGFTLDWIASFLSDRYTTLKLVDHTTGKIKTVIGLPQGSPSHQFCIFSIMWISSKHALTLQME